MATRKNSDDAPMDSSDSINRREPRKKTSSIFQRISTLFNYDKKNGRLIPEDFHDGTTLDKLINLFCSMASSSSFGLAIGSAFILYWKYNMIHTIGTNEFAYCVVALFMCDLIASTFAPLFIAWYGYGPVAIVTDIWRGVALFCAWTYFLEEPPLPHSMFTFFIGAPCLCCPLFLIGATCVDSWLFARYPQYRLIGNFVPLVFSVSNVGIANFAIYFVDNDSISLLGVACLSVIYTIMEIYFYVAKGYFHEPHDDTFTMSDFTTMMKGFFTTELVMKAWTSDAVLAISWVSFSWYEPIFSVNGENIVQVALAVVVVGCLAVVVGMGSVVSTFIYFTWGITDDEKLVTILLKGHVMVSWFSKIVYVSGLLFANSLYTRLGVCGFSLGQSLVTPNSMIMILSVSPNEIIPYTGFAQISFIFVAYGGSFFLNFYAGSFPSFAVAFAVFITTLGTILMGLLTWWVLYEVYFMNGENPRFSIRRRTTDSAIPMPQIPKMLVALEKCKDKNGKMNLP